MMTDTEILWEITLDRGKPLIMDADSTWSYLQKQGDQVKSIKKVEELLEIKDIFRTERRLEQ